MKAPHSQTPKPRYFLELEPVPGNWRTEPLLRFRALLKAALRGYGLRCVSCREVTDDDKGESNT
jgi:hypothetical protein